MEFLLISSLICISERYHIKGYEKFIDYEALVQKEARVVDLKTALSHSNF